MELESRQVSTMCFNRESIIIKYTIFVIFFSIYFIFYIYKLNKIERDNMEDLTGNWWLDFLNIRDKFKNVEYQIELYLPKVIKNKLTRIS